MTTSNDGHGDDDDVLGIDLDAWQPPPPPAHIADGVIARMRAETTSVTVQALPVEAHGAASKRRWLAGGALVAAAATALVVFGLTRGPADAHGRVETERPTQLEIGPSSAAIDARTSIDWKREGDRITARQHAGAATWRVDEDDTLTIETAVGSIEATNASLRVEVKMLDEKKQIALSAVTAAAVAAVTIVVYEGVVKASDGTQVAAGTAYQIKGHGETVIEEDQARIGASAPDLVAKIDALEAQLAEKQAQLEAQAIPEDRPLIDPYAMPRPAVDVVPDGLGRAAIQRTMQGLGGEIRRCASNDEGTIALTVHVKPDGRVSKVDVTPGGVDRSTSDCIVGVVRGANFGATKSGGAFKYPLAFKAPSKFDPFAVPRPPRQDNADLGPNPFAKPKCNADGLLEKGKEAYSAGQVTAALVHFEAAFRCDGNKATLRLMFVSACRAKNVAKARELWHKMSRAQREPLVQVCMSTGVSRQQLDGDGAGRLHVINSVPATVLLDGEEIGETPVDIEVPAGKHKVTFVVGGDKHTFSVVVKPGGTVTLQQALE